MAILFSPVLNEQQFDANGDPLAGGFIYTYLARTTTPVTTYKTSTGTAHSNPIVLDSAGYYPNGTQLWLDSGELYKFEVQNSLGAVVRTYDDISPINDNASTPVDEWVIFNLSAFTYVSATSFSVVGDQTGIFQVGRRLKTENTGGTVYSTITNSVYGAPNTTVTVVNNSGVLDSGLSAVSYGILAALNWSVPSIANHYQFARRTIITGSGTHNYLSGARLAFVQVQGGGGAGGGAFAAGATLAGSAGGGGAGAYANKFCNIVGISSATIVVGAGGTGVSSANGNPGGVSSYTDGTNTISCPGGLGGTSATGVGYTVSYPGGAKTATPTGGDINQIGNAGHIGLSSGQTSMTVARSMVASGKGADSNFGAGGASVSINSTANVSTAGENGSGFGSGGSGGGYIQGTGGNAGGDGRIGVVIIDEYY